MCGICGIYNFNKKEVQKEELQTMNNRMTFRGPDNEGYYISNNIGIAMKRLAIIDLDTGEQPISDYDRDVHLILNGEIYNFIELKTELIEKGHKFKTNSDTEVLLKYYIEYGENFIHKINGIFSFAILDKKKNKVLIYRDRIGVKPLYYYKDNKTFVFSSNLDSLSSRVKTSYNVDAVYSYLITNYVPSQQTIKNHISKLSPGSYIKIEGNQFSINEYWSISNIKKKNNYNFYEEFENTLNDTIKIQSRTDVKIGSFLSGGVDSSVLTYLLGKYVKKFETFTVNFEKKKNLDLKYATKISKELGLKQNITNINLENNLDKYLDEIIYYLDEPISDTAIFSTFQLSKLAHSTNTKVIITGAGGDEIFGGYHRHFKKNYFTKIFGNININTLLQIKNYLKKDYLNHFLKIFNSEIDFVLGSSGVNINLLSKIIIDEDRFLQNLIEIIHNHKKNNYNFKYFEDRLKIDLTNYLPDNILSLTDKMSMASSVEARTPFLDHRLIEMVFSNPDKKIFGNNINASKKILKKLFSNSLKTNIWLRKKEGFNAPSNNWIYKNKLYLINYFNENLSKYLNEIIDSTCLINDINSIKSSKDKRIQSIFSIYVLNKWLRVRNG